MPSEDTNAAITNSYVNIVAVKDDTIIAFFDCTFNNNTYDNIIDQWELCIP